MSGPIAPPWAIIPGLIGQRWCTDCLAQDAPIEGLERDILVGLNGVFLQADRPVGRLTVPHTPAVGPLHGLWPVAPGVRLRHGPLPLALVAEALELFAFAARWVPPLELIAPIVLDGDRYALHLPEQDPATHRVEYLAPALWPVGLTLHNHHTIRAYFSTTDDRDEVAPGLYGVAGHLDRPCPELRLRAGIEGHFLPLAARDLFAGAAAAEGLLFTEPTECAPGAGAVEMGSCGEWTPPWGESPRTEIDN